ncbi:MAG: carbohydrate-binding family 6 protein [Opitutus sp.]
MKKISALFLCALIASGACRLAGMETYKVYFDQAVPQLKFGADEIKAELAKIHATHASEPLAAFPESAATVAIVIAGTPADSTRISKQLDATVPDHRTAQSYSIRRKQDARGTIIAVLAGDANGAMYGALDVAEAIKLGTLTTLPNSDREPFVEKRGLKFNLSLDLRSPTYSDRADASQQNIPEMWSMDFWHSLLDEMARDRYNVISLWSLHPFPSLVKVPEFPNIALADVWRKTSPDKEDLTGNKANDVPLELKGGYEVLKKISIEAKVKFWRDVMHYAQDRGIAVYLFTWNIFTHGTDGKYGITDKQDNETTIAYFRASVRETVLTYPLLAGIGVTAGEHMQNLKGEYSNENWLWKTYGEGVRDALKISPDRQLTLTHRFHMASQREILEAWKDYPGEFNFGFKYLYAHMYSDTKSVFIQPALEQLSRGAKMWVELRNDDIYSFRWGDPDFAREFVRNLPPADKLEGFLMGPDGYSWGREFLSTEPETPRQLVLQKQWFSFLQWGRLSFDPTIPDVHFEHLLGARFPQVNATTLFAASCTASKIFPEITRFHWGDIDIRWFPEACIRSGKFLTVRDFIIQVTMPGTPDLNIKLWRDAKLAGENLEGKTPLEVAAALRSYARDTLRLVAELRAMPSDNKELRLTLGDYEAFAHLGNYYAEKILGAAELALYDGSVDPSRQAAAIHHLEAALEHWQKYAAIYTRQYVQPVRYGRAGLVDIPGKLMAAVATDIELARHWQPGTIKGPLVGRNELNFKP